MNRDVWEFIFRQLEIAETELGRFSLHPALHSIKVVSNKQFYGYVFDKSLFMAQQLRFLVNCKKGLCPVALLCLDHFWIKSVEKLDGTEIVFSIRNH